VARNKFKAAINHIKSTRIDEKIQRLNEAPTNSLSGVYDLSPAGQRFGEKDPPKKFYSKIDATWPPGIPGVPGQREYVRPRGYWEEGPGTVPSVDYDEIVQLDFSYSTQADDPRNTKTIIDETTGRVKSDLPPNSRSFILGPLVDMYHHNHRFDARTYVGYIQKDTREFVLLGSIRGTWGNDNNGVPIRADGFETGHSAYIWDGTDTSFTSYNPSFTFDMLQWHYERLKEGRYVKNVSFFNSGGTPVSRGAGGTGQPAGTNQGNVSGTPGPGDAANNGNADQTHGSGDSATIGTEQNPPITGDAEDNNLFGDMFKALQNFGQSVLDALNPGSLAQLGARMLRSLTDAATYAGDYIFKGLAEGVNYLPDFTGGSNIGLPKIADMPGAIARAFTGGQANPVSNAIDNAVRGVLGGNYATQYFTPDVGTAVKYAGEGGTVVAIPRTQGVAGIKNWFGSNVSRGFDPSKGVEQLVRTSDTIAADAAGATQKFALNNADDVAKMTQLASQGSKANTVLGKLGRAVPFVGAAAATADVSIRTAQGDYAGALLGGISAIPGPVGWVGLGAQIISDATGISNPNSPSNQMLKGLINTGSISGSTSGRGAGRRAFREEYLTEDDELSFLDDLRGAMFEMGVPMNKTEYAKQQCALLLSMGINPGLVMLIAKAIQQEPFTPNEEKYLKKNLPTMISMFANIREQINVQATSKNNVKESRQVLAESRQRILREIKQPVAEVSELKPEKLKKYRPNFKGRFSAQNTPDVTACKESDNMVKAKNAAGQTWRTSDKYWGGYESQERINVIYDHVGHGQIYWDEIVAHNQGKKGVRNRDVQEELNKHYAVLAERKIMRELGLNEQETLEAPNDPLLKRVIGKLKPQIDYPDKPSPMGYPDGPTPQQVAGYHPEYGKRANYYDRLDQKSADAMPATGDPEIDAKVNAQKTPVLKRVSAIRKKKGKPNS